MSARDGSAVPVGPEPQALVGAQMPPFPTAPQTELEKLRSDVARLQGLLAAAAREVHNTRRERDSMRERVSEPYGCTHCGVAKRSHGRRYISSAGMHSWERPSDEQVRDRMLARRAAGRPLPGIPELDRAQNELTGVRLSLWEEEQENARLRLALESAKCGRRELRARVAEVATEIARFGIYGAAVPATKALVKRADELVTENAVLRARVADLEAERHSTNEALSDAAEALRANRDRIAELEAARTGSGGHSHPEADDVTPQVRKLRALLAGQRAAAETDPGRRAAWRMVAEPLEDPHDSPLHHDYRVGRDLPQTGGAQ